MSYRDPLETSGSLRGDSFPPGWSEPLAQLAAELERADRGLPFPCLALLRADADHDVEALETGLSALAARAGWRLASARFSRPARFPHGALSAILESVAGFVDLSASGLWKDCSALGLLAPAMALEAPAEARQLALRGAGGSLLLSRSLADFFARLGRESRTVILLRDLQRADREDLLMLRTLSGYVHHRNAEEAEERGPAAPIRIFIVATFLRPAIDAGERGDEGQAQTIREIGDEPYTVNIRAGLLSIEETADWLASRDPSRALDAERVRRIHEACGGRTRRLEELWRRIPAAPGERVAPARAARPAGDAAQPADAGARDVPGLPADLVDASHERVCALAQPDRRLLELMAVAPEASFPLDVMRRAGLRLLEREDSPRAQQGLPSSESASPEDAPVRRSPEHAPAGVSSAGSPPEGPSADAPA
ncbi:MAG: hypothetical protein JXA90_06285, partial [Planctomycetes bacterium]|nr:hypothetical protein [Planctomycetota bacterium]